jgi:hypothetical protein
MRGSSQWDVGSEWIATGGMYPGMGESIGLAATSPELADGGMFNDGGNVGDPPYDTDQAARFESSMGANSGGYGDSAAYGTGGGSGYYNPGGSNGRGDVATATVDEGADDNPLVGLAIFSGITLGLFWVLHRVRVGDSDRFASIKGTAGDLAIIGVGAAFVVPLVKSSITWIADMTDWGPAYDTAAYVNAG